MVVRIRLRNVTFLKAGEVKRASDAPASRVPCQAKSGMIRESLIFQYLARVLTSSLLLSLTQVSSDTDPAAKSMFESRARRLGEYAP